MNLRVRNVAGRIARAVAVPTLCAAALAAAVVLPAHLARAEPATLTIVHVNDLDRLDGSGGRGGVARLAAVVREVRAGSAGRVLVTNGGDAISPSLLSSFDRGAHMIDLFNRVGFDAMVLGNHEFDFTPAVTVERIAEARFPILSSNAVEPDGTLIDGVTGHLLLEVGRYKVGVFGLTTVTTAIKSSPAPVTFRPVVEVAAEQAEKLREAGADLVIALAHTDRAEDAALMRQGAVDLLLSGDDHDMKIEVGPETTFVESGEQAEFVTVVEVVMGTVEGRDGPRFVWEPSFRVVNTVSVAPDPEIEAVVEEYLARLSEELDVEIGATAVALDSRRRVVRSRETGIANLIADAMRAATGADVALINGGGIRADKVSPPGTILTRRDVRSELPFDDKTVVLEVSGGRSSRGGRAWGERDRQRRRQVRARLGDGVPLRRLEAGRPPHRRGHGGRCPARPRADLPPRDLRLPRTRRRRLRHARHGPADRRRQRRHPGGRPGHRGDRRRRRDRPAGRRPDRPLD